MKLLTAVCCLMFFGLFVMSMPVFAQDRKITPRPGATTPAPEATPGVPEATPPASGGGGSGSGSGSGSGGGSTNPFAAEICEGAKNGAGSDCSGSSFLKGLKNIANIILFLIGAVAVIMIIIGGFRYVVSGGDSSGVEGAKNTILYAVIGLIVAALSFAIVNFVITSISGSGSGGGTGSTPGSSSGPPGGSSGP